jgi:hypothetical protein
VNGARMTEDRVATKDAHVFTLRAPVKTTKEDIAFMCKRLPD